MMNHVAIVGAGPAGLQAAVAAANSGAEVTLIDGSPQPGGQYYRQLPGAFQLQAAGQKIDKAAALFNRLSHPRITFLPQTRVLGISSNGRKLWLHGSEAPEHLEAAAIILATGAYDRPAAFPGWTLPGVLSVGAAQVMVKGQRVLPGRRVLVTGTGPLLLAAGAALIWGGAQVVGVLEGSTNVRRFQPHQWTYLKGQWSRLREGGRYLRALVQARVPYKLGWAVIEALGTPKDGVSGALIAPLDALWRPLVEKARKVECDTICIGYGFIPEIALSRLSGAEHTYQSEYGGWVPLRDPLLQTTVPNLYVAGDGAGIGGAAQSELEGQLAGIAAASHTQANNTDLLRPVAKKLEEARKFQQLYGRLFTPQPGMHHWARADTILCRCENVNRTVVESAVTLGAHTVNEVKGLTRAGMGSCQGRLCSHLIAGQIKRLTGKSIASCGQLSARVPISPLALVDASDLAGQIGDGEQ